MRGGDPLATGRRGGEPPPSDPEAGIFQGKLHGYGRAGAVFGRRRNMMSVISCTITGHFSKNIGAASLGVFERFENDDPRAFPGGLSAPAGPQH